MSIIWIRPHCPRVLLPTAQLRLNGFNPFPWSSWRVYSGEESKPAWLETAVVGAGCGGGNRTAQRAALRAYTEAPIREGHLESPWEKLRGGLVLGDEAYAERLLREAKVNAEEQTEARRLGRSARRSWREIVRAAEAELKRKWEDLAARHGDWGRDGILYVATRYGGYRLAELLEEMPELKYQAAAQGVRRFRLGLRADPAKERFVNRLKKQLSII